jgi:hypothetical protein
VDLFHRVDGATQERENVNTPTQKYGKKKKAIFCLLLFLILVGVTSIGYLGFAVYRSTSLYSYIKSNQRSWKGKIHTADSELGFAPIADSRGEHIFPIGPSIPMRYDGNGFRIPVDQKDTLEKPRPLLLTLGCSFTYGDAAYAKDTWAYLTGHYLNGYSINAGVGSYGLCQMLILARRLIPLYKPEFVIVQYSPWLVSRAMNAFAPTYFGKLPAPFFYQSETLDIHPPVFQTKILDLPIDTYYTSPKSASDFISFFWCVGIPLLIHDDYNMVLYTLKRAFHYIPDPDANQDEVVRYVYGEIAKMADENRAKLVILVLGKNHQEIEASGHLFPPHVIVVNAHKALLEALYVVNHENYMKRYAHWRGVPPRVVDTHPNEKAHQLIA